MGYGPSEVIICFLFVATAIGAVVGYLLSRFAPALPFTLVMFIIGIFLALWKQSYNFYVLGQSIDQWINISPNLILFIFLPALLFGEAMQLKLHHVRSTFKPAAILAGPGCIIGTYLTAWLCQGILPYDWSWNFYLVFGSILCATDPVAVVALLKSVKASPNLTMLITQESLLNDGSALVLYNLFFSLIAKDSHASNSPMYILKYFAKVLFISPLVGFAFGLATAALFSLVNKRTKADDVTIQVVLSLTCAYLSFFVGEYILEVSGVLTCCAAGKQFRLYSFLEVKNF